MTKEERLKAAEAYAIGRGTDKDKKAFRTITNRDLYDHTVQCFEAGAEAEAESNKSVSVQDAKQFMWEWLNRTDMLDVSLDNEDVQLLMTDFVNSKIEQLKSFLYEEIINRREYSASKSFEVVLEKIEELFK